MLDDSNQSSMKTDITFQKCKLEKIIEIIV